jgi:hypothetical protein
MLCQVGGERAERAPMNDQLKTLLEVRDRLGARLADYDFKVLTLLFGIAAAWGMIKGMDLSASPLIAIFLAFAGLIVSVGWAIQRRMLWRVDESYADAIKATARAGADGSALDRPAAPAGRVRLHYGEPFSMAVFALLTGIAIWTYQVPQALTEPAMAMPVPRETDDGQRWIVVGSGGSLTFVYDVYPEYYADGEDCFCDDDFAAAPSSYGEEQYAPLSHGVVPFDPGSKKLSW